MRVVDVNRLLCVASSEEKLICDQINLEALTVNQVKSFKALADGKDVFIGTKMGSGIFAYISSITCAPCKASSDWIRVLVAVTNDEQEHVFLNFYCILM
jgi:hypothetical protein